MQFIQAARPGLFLSLAIATTAWAQPGTLDDCARIPQDAARLRCFDELAASQRKPDTGTVAQPSPAPIEPAEAHTAPQEKSFLAEHWETGPGTKRGTFAFRPHQHNYLVATYTDSPNSEPYRPFRRLVPGAGDLSPAELMFQLGFKMKLAENAGGSPADLWFGYTQRSFWQAGNREASSPFRETNYQPEAMVVLPLNLNLLGFKARFINFGLVHQSNGQASTLSRSWNRVYVQAGMERENLELVGRLWRRLSESASSDDNPDIIDYMGRGDLSATYRWRGHEFSALTRYNFSTNKGAAQLNWAFPIAEHLKGYVQWFSGYGHSLIDYNHSQNVMGLGVLISY